MEAQVHRPPTPPARARPDPAGLRAAFGAGGLAALSALVTAIVTTPSPSVATAVTTTTGGAAQAGNATVAQQRQVQYVQLAPGQSAPPGARVIDAKAPKPITIVTQVPAPAPQTIVVRTTQSGRVLP